jgi:1-acyl-sn-glycerol-3-phosphate acyltransferase
VFFSLLKAYAKLAIKIYCRRIIINKPGWLQAKGPLLLACNHPNSFLDGMILTTLFEENIYSLARGDAFRNRNHNKILRWLNLLPVYRTSEGTENLEHNYTTFESCIEIFKKGGIVIIFSEGRCVNEWHLRPLKKGTARLATSAWMEGIDLVVLPVGINYNSFRNFGKNVFINFGEPMHKQEIMSHVADGRMFLSFNEQLTAELQKLVFDIPKNDRNALAEKVVISLSTWKKILLTLPALLGFILHVPLYFPVKALNKKYFNNDHFDSTMVGILTLAYPVYLLFFFLLVALLWSWLPACLVVIVLPFTAWCLVQWKPQI